MKKFDSIIILLVLLIAGLIYSVYFNKYKLSSNDNLVVEITYKNEIIKRVLLTEDANEIVEISRDGHLNVVSITYEEIKMIDADCDDKHCMRMRTNYKTITPIVCTNGVTVRVVGVSSGDIDYIIP